MPDIAMCSGVDCPMKEKCHRFTAKPDEYQSYFSIPPFKKEHGKPDCEFFWGESADLLFAQLTSIMNDKTK